jgi:hypothetical protein
MDLRGGMSFTLWGQDTQIGLAVDEHQQKG